MQRLFLKEQFTLLYGVTRQNFELFELRALLHLRQNVSISQFKLGSTSSVVKLPRMGTFFFMKKVARYANRENDEFHTWCWLTTAQRSMHSNVDLEFFFLPVGPQLHLKCVLSMLSQTLKLVLHEFLVFQKHSQIFIGSLVTDQSYKNKNSSRGSSLP